MKRRVLLHAGVAAPWVGFAGAQPADGRLAGERPASASDAVERPVIEWPEIRLLDGRTLSPSSWQGQAAVVVFWATYCPFCERHNAHIDKLQRTTQGQPLRVLGVAVDKDAEAVRRYMVRHRYTFPVALDDGNLRRRLNARRVIPLTYVIDRQGRLLQTIPGEMFEADVLDLARVAQRPTG